MSWPPIPVFPAAAAAAANGFAVVVVERFAPATYTITIPDNCVAWECHIIGGGGSGGAVEGDTANDMNATGGAGGDGGRGEIKVFEW